MFVWRDAIAGAIGPLVVIIIAILLFIFAAVFTADAHDPSHYPNMSTAQLEWYRSQKIPGGQHKGAICCNEFDGVDAEEDIRDGSYWTRWLPGQEWMRVPQEAIINGRNPNGTPVVWFGRHMDGQLSIRCYVPGFAI